MFKTQKPHTVQLPFKSRREEVERQKREREQFFVNRALDQAEGFSWSKARQPRTFLERWRAFPLVNKLAAVGSVGIAVVILSAFVGVAGHDNEPAARLIYVESWGADRSLADVERDRAVRAAEAAREQAAFEAQVKAAQAEQARQSAARSQQAPA